MSFTDIKVSPSKKYCDIFLQSAPNCLRTSSVDNIHLFFQTELASIMRCKCYNGAHLPFYEEIKDTEIGHLVEHVLLEYLCEEKIKLGHSLAEYSGRTYWNWRSSPPGSFRIRIKIVETENEILEKALQKTLQLLERLPQPKADSHSLSTFGPMLGA